MKKLFKVIVHYQYLYYLQTHDLREEHPILQKANRTFFIVAKTDGDAREYGIDEVFSNTSWTDKNELKIRYCEIVVQSKIDHFIE